MRPRHDSRRGYSDRELPDGGYGKEHAYAPELYRVQALNWHWIPAVGISRDVIQADIKRYLGPEALVRPGEGSEQYAGVPGFRIGAYRTLTASMIQDLKADSANWQRERGQSGVRYEDSRFRESRQYWGPSEAQYQVQERYNSYAPAAYPPRSQLRTETKSHRLTPDPMFQIRPEVLGHIGQIDVTALPDTGAEQCSISLELAKLVGKEINKNEKPIFKLPSGKSVKSLGTMEIPWQFSKETKVYNIACAVLETCTPGMILGGKFLSDTQTLTQNAHRIISKMIRIPSRRHVHLLGSQRQRVWGKLNGEMSTALPDLGSDVMLVSPKYVQRMDLHVDKEMDHQIELEFVDGSRSFTDGIVYDVEWEFGNSGTKFTTNLYVLRGLEDVDIVLSNDFLDRCKAFTTYQPFFYNSDNDSGLNIHELGIVRLLSRKYVSSTEDLETEELRRRDENRELICKLPEDQRETAWEKEERRKAQEQQRINQIVAQQESATSSTDWNTTQSTIDAQPSRTSNSALDSEKSTHTTQNGLTTQQQSSANVLPMKDGLIFHNNGRPSWPTVVSSRFRRVFGGQK